MNICWCQPVWNTDRHTTCSVFTLRKRWTASLWLQQQCDETTNHVTALQFQTLGRLVAELQTADWDHEAFRKCGNLMTQSSVVWTSQTGPCIPTCRRVESHSVRETLLIWKGFRCINKKTHLNYKTFLQAVFQWGKKLIFPALMFLISSLRNTCGTLFQTCRKYTNSILE